MIKKNANFGYPLWKKDCCYHNQNHPELDIEAVLNVLTGFRIVSLFTYALAFSSRKDWALLTGKMRLKLESFLPQEIMDSSLALMKPKLV